MKDCLEISEARDRSDYDAAHRGIKARKVRGYLGGGAPAMSRVSESHRPQIESQVRKPLRRQQTGLQILQWH